jgi:hypothetical protein
VSHQAHLYLLGKGDLLGRSEKGDLLGLLGTGNVLGHLSLCQYVYWLLWHHSDVVTAIWNMLL